jgi:hypothetical protein
MQIKEFREKYPEYNRLSDEQLTISLHRRFYKNKPLAEFAQKFGVTIDPQIAPLTAIESEPLQETEPGYMPSEPRTLAGQLRQMRAPEGAGATAGSLAMMRLASQLPPPYRGPATVAAPFVGAAIGGPGGKAYDQLARRITGEHMSLERIRDEQFQAAISETINEVLGQGAGALANKLMAPGAKTLIPDAPRLSVKLSEAAKRIPAEEAAKLTPKARRLLQRRGVYLSAAQATESRTIDLGEAVLENALLGGEGLFQLKNVLQPAALRQMTKEMSERFWKEAGERMSSTEVGELFLETLVQKKGVQSKMANVMYSHLDEVAGDAVRVNMQPVKKLAQETLDAASKSKGLGSSSAIRKLSKKVMQWDDVVNFRAAHEMRSNLLEEVRKLEVPLGQKAPKLRRVTDLLAHQTDRAMSKAAKEYDATKPGVDLYGEWRLANNFVKKTKKELSAPIIESAVKWAQKNPEKVSQQIFRPNATRQIAAVKKVVGTKTFNSLRASWLDSLFSKIAKPDVHTVGTETETLMGMRFADAINSMGDDTLRVIFDDPGHLAAVRDLARTAQIVQKPTGSGAAIWVKLAQMGAIVGLAGFRGEAKMADLGVIAVPGVAGRIMSSRTGAKWLSEGLRLPVNVSREVAEKWVRNAPAPVIRILRAAYLAREKKQQAPAGQELRGFGGRGF